MDCNRLNGPTWTKADQNRPKMDQIDKNKPSWTKINQNRLK